MSRTDVHAPLHVRMARRELAAVASHRCEAAGNCDLPALELLSHLQAWGASCRWFPCYTGTGFCPCDLCHLGYLNLSDNRQDRHTSRVRLAASLGAWRAGCHDAFDW